MLVSHYTIPLIIVGVDIKYKHTFRLISKITEVIFVFLKEPESYSIAYSYIRDNNFSSSFFLLFLILMKLFLCLFLLKTRLNTKKKIFILFVREMPSFHTFHQLSVKCVCFHHSFDSQRIISEINITYFSEVDNLMNKTIKTRTFSLKGNIQGYCLFDSRHSSCLEIWLYYFCPVQV